MEILGMREATHHGRRIRLHTNKAILMKIPKAYPRKHSIHNSLNPVFNTPDSIGNASFSNLLSVILVLQGKFSLVSVGRMNKALVIVGFCQPQTFLSLLD